MNVPLRLYADELYGAACDWPAVDDATMARLFASLWAARGYDALGELPNADVIAIETLIGRALLAFGAEPDEPMRYAAACSAVGDRIVLAFQALVRNAITLDLRETAASQLERQPCYDVDAEGERRRDEREVAA